MLSCAARLTIAVRGLEPAMPTIDDSAEHDLDQARVASAHRSLTGMVVGSSAAASLGAVLASADGWPRGVIFTAVVGLILLLRARTYIDAARRIASAAGGVTALMSSFAAAVVSTPGQGNWISALAVFAGVGALGSAFGNVTISPVLRRGVDVAEYLALAALVPLACWVVDLYGLVRAANLT
jgi:type VII secretion integral membrane protein EccD